MNTTEIIRSKKPKENPFTRIPNSIGKLKAEEIGIMFHMLSNSDDWVINKDDIFRKSQLGKTRFSKAWNHLKELGYIVVARLPRKNGQFYSHYTIYEIPEVQNQSTETDKPYTENRSTVDHITVTGGTNNYYIINKDQEITASSGSNGLETEWRVRPGKNNTGPHILGQENKKEEHLQIVPPSPLHYESGRDDERGPIKDPTNTSPTQDPNNTTPIVPLNSRSVQPEDHHGPISSEVCYSRREKISPDTQEILDNLEIMSSEDIKAMLNVYYTEDYPNWEYLLKKKLLQGFVKETSKLVVPDILATELLTEYNIRLKKEAYNKH